MMLYVAATLLVWLSAAAAAALWPTLEGHLDRLLAWFLMVPVLITATTLALGLVGWLTPLRLLVLHAVLALVLGAAAWWGRRRRPPAEADDRPQLGDQIAGALRQPWLWPLIAGWLATLAWSLFMGLKVPPFGWDALSYHIPPAVWWLQEGRIYPVPSEFTFGYAYPQGMSLLILWQLAFTATDHLVNLLQLPFAIMGAVAAYALAREVGIGRSWAIWASAFWGLAPLVVEQTLVPYNDVAIAALTLTALYFVLRFWRRCRIGTGHLWLAGCAVGLMLGIKANAFLVLGLIVILALVPLRRSPRRYIKDLGWRALALAVPSLLLASYWYIRNLVLYHNPIYPVAVKLLGITILPGPRTVTSLITVTPDQTPWETLLKGLREAIVTYSYDSPNGGFGAVFTCLGLAALAGALIHGIRSRRWRLVTVLCFGLLLYLLQPVKYPRYVLYLPALGGLAFGYCLQHLFGRTGRHLLQGAAAALLLYTLFLVPYQPQLSAEDIWQVGTAEASRQPLWAGSFGHARHYGFVATTPHLSHPDNRIAYTGTEFVYPLMGPDRSSRVYHIPPADYDQWVAELLKRRTTFLIVGRDWTIEQRWAQQHPEAFVQWAREWPFTVYLIRSDEPRNQLLLQFAPTEGVAPE